ncbi:MAG: DoxX family protein [Gemmatimonadetes bacterium]|nr:DoxX family protein [Gemmatimonadota bacterium]MDA1103450.1 DoxX family protein [Gemmatimonadota bacterium]
MERLGPSRAWGVLFARLVLGLMFFQGALWRVFGLGPLEHARRFFVGPYGDSPLPEWALWVAGAGVPFAELIGGALVLLGLWRLPGLILLGGVLVTVTFGHLMAEPIYAFNAHVMPRLILVVFLLSVPHDWDRFSVDEWLSRRRAP